MGKDSITFPPAVRCGSAKQDRFGASARLQAEQSAAIPGLREPGIPSQLATSRSGDPMTSNAVDGPEGFKGRRG